ncbi:hypothetical protein KAR48_02010 [bacterium]|nr:hypothetical protein [bacterium]
MRKPLQSPTKPITSPPRQGRGGEDFIAVEPTVVTFLPGEFLKTVSVKICDDNLYEADETFYLELSNVQNGILNHWGVKTNFIIVNDDEVSLPVQLSSFKAEPLIRGMSLHWTTQSETDNLGFILERAIHNAPQQWNVMASYETHPELMGQGNSSECHEYTFTDKTAQPPARCFITASLT